VRFTSEFRSPYEGFNPDHWCCHCHRKIGKDADIIYDFGFTWIAHQKCYDKHGEPEK
jgi:hypothetical protein